MSPFPSCPTATAARHLAPGSRAVNVTRTPEHSARMIQHLAWCCILEASAIWQLREVAIWEAPRTSPALFRAPRRLFFVVHIQDIQYKHRGLLQSASCAKAATPCFGMSPVNLVLRAYFTPVFHQRIMSTF